MLRRMIDARPRTLMRTELEQIRVVEAPGVAHLKYRAVK